MIINGNQYLVFERVMPALLSVSNKVEFMSIIAAAVDCWSACYGLCEEETLDIFECLSDVQKTVHSKIAEVVAEVNDK